MELQRILARDTRSATEQALSRFGPNVLVISNHRVAGQTELVVAVDVQAPSQDDDEVLVASAAPAQTAPAQPQLVESFEAKLHAVMAQKAVLENKDATETVANPAVSASLDRDWIRSREIVATVREEIAALRQEFRLSQQTMMWQAQQSWPEALAPLVQGLSEAAVPASMRALLLDGLREETHLSAALDAITRQLICNIPEGRCEAPAQGVHVLAGPSGGGKTLMVARLARHFLKHGTPEQVAVISFKDARAGAWPQMQMLCAQMGVDTFRAKTPEVMRLLLDELSDRALVLIDTPGVQLHENLAELLSICPAAQCHAVLPADASSVTLQRVLAQGQTAWASLILTKLDESSAPWPLLQHLMNSPQRINLSVGSGSDNLAEGLQAISPAMLADLAVAQWMPEVSTGLAIRDAKVSNRLMELQAVHG
jgi:flagellar biosynthesis protein FlhF